MALISDILRGPYGDPQPNVIITMRAKETSARVLVSNSSAAITAADGKYSMQVFPGEYEVLVSTLGKVGEIRVYPDSKDGTLNDFLITPGEDELTPAIVQTVDTMRVEAAKSADKSAASASAAKVSEQNAATSADQVVTSFDNVRWPVPDNPASSPAWFFLGTFKRAGQKGVGIAINFYGNARYSGFIEHAGLSRLILRTGNLTADGTTNNVGRIGGVLVDDAAVDGSTSLIRGIQIIESTRDNYDIYVMVGEFTSNCWYVVEQSKYEYAAGLRWEHKGISQTTTPAGVMQVDILRSVSYSITNGLLPNYVSVAKPFSNGFVTYLGRRISGTDVESQVALMNSLRGRGSEIFRVGGGSKIGMPPDGTSIHLMSGDVSAVIAVDYNNGNVNTMACNGTGLTAGIVKSNTLWGTSNTTIDSNGFIKKASPIVKLFRDGTCELNDESQGVTTERVSEGIYRISGTLGFNADAQWGGSDGGIEVPLDRNKQPLIWVDYEVEPTGDLLIKTYHRTHPTAPAFARNEVLGYDEGMPIDIPEGRWVDLRVEMPAVEEPDPEIEIEKREAES
ncbi:phage tail fiber protein [Serratia marcescens]|uniref:phage tail fiber protein n=1 Tax=Serratia marcescens TaxID=615 RepID=UPI000B786839|nr:prophage tail fiber N-terminal domain-containing protein [Serratia marcescens]